ncbi:pleckstrin homology domain-containing family H member 2-like isoform X2 [Orbicella faveolata]|uniref:pleckstrin homology domain-containing family H member 2-like isoform X2 n=1 Tax=Orbicella faveolata TaxID=48498 RepID=UPI0009E20C66|nr:pleckstrin homology domain-containing family H member 2-like isoform X2 [Orbicella faveolata]
MDNSPRSNGPQVYSTEVGENEIDYKQRCKYLENQLEKFREQAAKVREVIGHKVQRLETLLAVKDQTVAHLETELESEKQRRIVREREVEDKAAHIKNWMHNKISEYEDKLQELTKENEQLRTSHKQAMELIKEIEIKLHFSQDQVVRLSSELAEVQSQCGDYYVLESETDQGESGFQSFQNEDVRSPTLVDSSSSLNTTLTPMSPDELAQETVEDSNDTGTIISDQPAEIQIKRTSSGKSPSKIPRYIGNSDDPRAAQISYYMSLKRGLTSPGSSQAKFFIQVQNSHNPYMQLVSSENLSRKKLYDSQSTVDSELEDSAFETYLQPGDQVFDGEEFHAQLGELVTLHLENQSLAPSVAKTEQESLSDSRSSVGSLTEPTVSPNPIYQSLEQELDSAQQEIDSARTCLDSVTESQVSVDSGVPLSPPPPPVPPRFEPENAVPPPVPPVPKANLREQPQEVVRMEANFTSYLAETELQSEEAPQVNKEDVAVALLQGGIQSWMWNDDSVGSDSPPFGTLENNTKDLNMLTV